jgi:hypothetical protein
MKYVINFILPLLLLFGCGPKGDKINNTPPPLPQVAVLVNYKPLQGMHVPLTQFFSYKEEKFTSVYFSGEVLNTFSWVTFKNSSVGQNLIGAFFKNGEAGKEFYLWFKVQMTPTEDAEYTLELYKTGPLIRGYEMLRIGANPETVMSVTYSPPPPSVSPK